MSDIQELDEELQATLDRATVAMAKAKALIDEGEAIKKDVKEQILPLMASFGVKTSVLVGVGSIGFRSGGGSTINPQALTVALLERGFDAEDAVNIIAASTKSWTYDFVEFRGPKKS
jgi:glycerol uptake facilitator-like aquaporin